jgi:exodeoxyribonuclease VII small subunit
VAPGHEDQSFDKVLGRLRGVVERLEGGELGLEEALRVFEEGVRLSRRGAEILDAAERRVEVLLKGGDIVDRTVATEPPDGEPAPGTARP